MTLTYGTNSFSWVFSTDLELRWSSEKMWVQRSPFKGRDLKIVLMALAKNVRATI
jgi:hypothetical protein